MQLATELADLPQEEAAFYAWLGLHTGVLTLADVSEWADEVIGREDAPDEFFLQLYRRLRTYPDGVRPWVRAASRHVRFSARPALHWLHHRLSAEAWPLPRVLAVLYQFRTLMSSDQEVGWIYALSADHARAAQQPDALPAVQQETEAFLVCYRDYTFANRWQWPELNEALMQRLAALGRTGRE